MYVFARCRFSCQLDLMYQNRPDLMYRIIYLCTAYSSVYCMQELAYLPEAYFAAACVSGGYTVLGFICEITMAIICIVNHFCIKVKIVILKFYIFLMQLF